MQPTFKLQFEIIFHISRPVSFHHLLSFQNEVIPITFWHFQLQMILGTINSRDNENSNGVVDVQPGGKGHHRAANLPVLKARAFWNHHDAWLFLSGSNFDTNGPLERRVKEGKKGVKRTCAHSKRSSKNGHFNAQAGGPHAKVHGMLLLLCMAQALCWHGSKGWGLQTRRGGCQNVWGSRLVHKLHKKDFIWRETALQFDLMSQ